MVTARLARGEWRTGGLALARRMRGENVDMPKIKIARDIASDVQAHRATSS